MSVKRTRFERDERLVVAGIVLLLQLLLLLRQGNGHDEESHFIFCARERFPTVSLHLVPMTMNLVLRFVMSASNAEIRVIDVSNIYLRIELTRSKDIFL
jgi:hypothetical protein